MSQAPGLSGDSAALFTDLYQLTMAQAYLAEGMQERATFSLFARRLPPRRNYLLACGLEDVLSFLETVRFSAADLAYLRSLGTFSERLLDYLAGFRFTGDVFAVPEGTPVFADEPLLEVVAPIPQAQILETFIMNAMHAQTVLASKASRVVQAAAGRAVLDFGLRRCHGFEGGLRAARAYHIAGMTATSNVLAGRVFGVPVAGTMAHSYIQAHDDELGAFRAFAREFPATVLLVDTYDSLEGVRRVVRLARELGDDFQVRGIRLDSGDLGALARDARRILDDAGLSGVKIFASGGLTEEAIAELVAAGAPIDGFGIGTALGVSADAPTLDTAYKLTAYAGRGRMKLSEGKRTLPGQKQVFRRHDGGRVAGDVLARWGEELAGEPLLRQVMAGGARLPAGRAGLSEARERARRGVAALPDRLRALEPADPPLAVEVSEALSRLAAEVAAHVGGAHRR